MPEITKRVTIVFIFALVIAILFPPVEKLRCNNWNEEQCSMVFDGFDFILEKRGYFNRSSIRFINNVVIMRENKKRKNEYV